MTGWAPCLVAETANDEFSIRSPDGRILVNIEAGENLKYTISAGGKTVVEPSALGIHIGGADLGIGARIDRIPAEQTLKEEFSVMGGHSRAASVSNDAVLALVSGASKVPWFLEVRVFNEGVAYRYVVKGGKKQVGGESSEWVVPEGARLWYQGDENRSYEDRYHTGLVGELPSGLTLMVPATLQLPDNGGYAVLTEANVVNYSDMALELDGKNAFKALFHNDPTGWKQTAPGDVVSPWRVTLIAENLNALVNSDVIQSLCPPPAPNLARAAWIKPGRSLWHWLTGGGPKLEEQRSWINGTQEMGYEYYLIDDGWKDWFHEEGKLDRRNKVWAALADLVRYARTKNVSIWLWVGAGDVFDREDQAAVFRKAKQTGIVGLKIDFPHAANYEWVNWYEQILELAAAKELMVDFHGAMKPSGRERTWPNEMSREAVAGREQGKSPSAHDTTLPFVRYVQGHADFTPTLFGPDRLNGSSLAHELAMAIVFTSPFLCMGDRPEHYLQSEAVDILRNLPPIWDETIVLPGSEIGKMAAFARRSGRDWFIGVINGEAGTGSVDLRFLGAGNFKLVELRDAEDRNDAFVRSERMVSGGDKLSFPMRTDGGYVAWLKAQ